MKEYSKYLAGLFLILSLFPAACSDDDQVKYEFPEPDEDVFIDLPAEWQLASSLMTGLPEGIEVYRNFTPYNEKTLNAYCVVLDPNIVELKPVLADVNTKPSDFYIAASGTTYAVINGGFFGTNISYSLVQHDNEVLAVNIQALTRPYNGSSATYYPTRGAFGLKSDNTPDITWIYNVGGANGTMYNYPAPSPNALNSAPEPQPSASFPQGGAVWNVHTAIGGSPVLISDGQVNITDTEELISINNTASRARSAIGYTAGGKVILLAVEGNNPDGGDGLNLQELAVLMKEMGCTAALNLDGGGSTYMMVNGEETVKPSSSSGERAVMSVIIIKEK